MSSTRRHCEMGAVVKMDEAESNFKISKANTEAAPGGGVRRASVRA